MKKILFLTLPLFLMSVLFYNCSTKAEGSEGEPHDSLVVAYGGFPNQVEWGKHLVLIGGCGDCHSPKMMTPQGPVPNPDLLLSGAQTPAPLPAITAEQVAKGTAATVDETAWIGPWGKSFAANLTSDSTGIGSWTEAQFITCLRKGVTKGLDGARPLMPPMPWQNIAQMSDGELKAIFAYLKTTKPVRNVAPAYEPPVTAMK